MRDKFAPDSPLEQRRFELSVPPPCQDAGRPRSTSIRMSFREGPKVCRLSAGGRWIRTVGPAHGILRCLSRKTVRPAIFRTCTRGPSFSRRASAGRVKPKAELSAAARPNAGPGRGVLGVDPLQFRRLWSSPVSDPSRQARPLLRRLCNEGARSTCPLLDWLTAPSRQTEEPGTRSRWCFRCIV